MSFIESRGIFGLVRRMRRRFHKPNCRQLHLLPVSIDQLVDEDRMARFLWDCVKHFNLEQFYAACGDKGSLPCNKNYKLKNND
ncbi:MAG: hypothetical protein EOM83_16595 [Clostridia bacterium]|nr:hypothetical protein [Clostridia bacterium]